MVTAQVYPAGLLCQWRRTSCLRFFVYKVMVTDEPRLLAPRQRETAHGAAPVLPRHRNGTHDARRPAAQARCRRRGRNGLRSRSSTSRSPEAAADRVARASGHSDGTTHPSRNVSRRRRSRSVRLSLEMKSSITTRRPPGDKGCRRGGEKRGRRREVDERFDCEREVKRREPGDADEIRGDECARRRQAPGLRLPARNPGLPRTDGDADTLHRRTDGAGKEEQAPADPAPDVQHAVRPPRSRRRAPPPRRLRGKQAIHIVHRLGKALHPVRPDGAPHGERSTADPQREEEPCVPFVVRADRGGDVFTVIAASHALIVPGVAK